MTRARRQGFAHAEQAVNAGHAGVKGGFDLVAHEARGQRRFFGHRNIGSAGADDMDHAVPVDGRILHDAGGLRELVIAGFAGHTPDGRIHFAAATGDQDIGFLRQQAADDRRHVLRFLLSPKMTSGNPWRSVR